MESFKELMKRKHQEGVSYTSMDGKRILSGGVVKLQTLVNMHITILDFEPDVSTANGPRYVVQFQRDDGIVGKYLTNDGEQKFWLEELKKDGKLPFDCILAPQYFAAGKVRYMFT